MTIKYCMSENTEPVACAHKIGNDCFEVSNALTAGVSAAFEEIRAALNLESWDGWRLFLRGNWGDEIEITPNTAPRLHDLETAVLDYAETLGFQCDGDGCYRRNVDAKGRVLAFAQTFEFNDDPAEIISYLQAKFPRRNIMEEIKKIAEAKQ